MMLSESRSAALAVAVLLGTTASGACAAGDIESLRQTITLDGVWQVAEGGMDEAPTRFAHAAPVPGLVDMAVPPFAEVGVASDRREAFWYRHTFRIGGPVPEVALLKVHKAKYGTRVFLNGADVGEHLPCFTPGFFDLRPHLRGDGAPNELVIRVGAFRTAVPPLIPSGWDFEKNAYIPGIYDSVELILSGSPHIVNVQAAPDLVEEAVRVRIVLRNAGKDGAATPLAIELEEKASGRAAGRLDIAAVTVPAGREQVVDVVVPITGARRWSPEDPFLYRLTVRSGADATDVTFGMRAFRFDGATGQAVLNDNPRYLRGTNICILRFFEDPERGALPWDREWVRGLHRLIKRMHWDAVRYCIGFPPDFWYDIADEEGLLVFDEFPLWHFTVPPPSLSGDQLAVEYGEWMHERWNHPSVVVWDAQNETASDETGKAIRAVRGLDLSGRPWDNGWGAPDRPDDPYESHPYLFNNALFRLEQIPQVRRVPVGLHRQPAGQPIVVNEYAWLWLNRDGDPTHLTEQLYENLLGADSTVEQRRHLHARYLAALTEYWRSTRTSASLQHFCILSYSRPTEKGATSDHFVDVAELQLEPDFERYVRDAFAPVGVMIDLWAEEFPAPTDWENGIGAMFAEHGDLLAHVEVPVVLINDLPEAWHGTVRLRLEREGEPLGEWTKQCTICALGERRLYFLIDRPQESGDYQLIAELLAEGAEPVRSYRDVPILTPEERAAREELRGNARQRKMKSDAFEEEKRRVEEEKRRAEGEADDDAGN